MKRNTIGLGLTGLAVMTLAACSSGSSESDGTGTLTLGLVDTPVFDIAHICILITDVNVKPQEGEALEFEVDLAGSEACDRPGEQIDLLSLRDPGNPALLLDAVTLDAGRYNWIELVLDAAVQGQSAAGSSYVIMNDGGEHDLRVPSGSIRLVSGFTLTAGQHTQFTLDWDARAGLSGVVNPPGQEGVLLRPAFRIIDMTEAATLSGRVSADFIANEAACAADDGADLDVGNVVYVFEGPVAADDMNSTDALATVDVERNDAGDYAYETLLAPGVYTIAFTCQGDLAGEDLAFELPDDDGLTDPEDPNVDANLEVEDGDEATVDFLTLQPS